MKKLFFLSLSIMLIVVCVCSFAACKKQCEVCTFGEWQTVTEPTCSTEGEKVRICTVCELEERDVIEKIEHDAFLKETMNEPTCTAKGIALWACSDCSHTEEREVKSNGHSYGEYEIVLPATCSSLGKKERICSVCGDKNAQNIAMIAHTYGESSVVKQATCRTEGAKKSTCTICGSTKRESIKKTAHDYSAATCQKGKTCKNCGLISGMPGSHDYAAATCAKPKTCMTCGVTTGGTVSHNYVAPTCTEPQKCVGCGTTSGVALGHTASSGTCGRCGQKIVNQEKLDAIAKENARHEGQLGTLKARYEANVGTAERTLSSLKRQYGISSLSSRQYYNRMISQNEQTIQQKLYLVSSSLTSSAEADRLWREIDELRDENTYYNTCLRMVELEEEIVNLERSYNKDVSSENALHQRNLQDINAKYGN